MWTLKKCESWVLAHLELCIMESGVAQMLLSSGSEQAALQDNHQSKNAW
jgi:hypothetical protein